MDKVSKKILEDAKKERDRIIKEAKKRKKEIDDEAKRELEKMADDIEKKAKETKEREFERLIGLKEIEHRNTLLAYKHELLNRLFEEVTEDILKSDKYQKLIESMFETAVQSGEEEVLIGEREKNIDKKFVQKLNKRYGWKLKLSDEKLHIKGGFFLRGKDKDFDGSIETLIKDKREDLVVKLVELLFG